MSVRQASLRAASGRAFWQLLAATALFVQLGMLSFWKNALGPYVSPLIHFAASILPGVSLIVLSIGGSSNGTEHRTAARNRARVLLTPLAVTILGALVFCLGAEVDLDAYPIDVLSPKKSDILPMITIMVGRLLRGEFPYTVISTWGYDLPPTYLPLQWLPFIAAEVLAIDYRWIAFAGLAAGILAYESRLFRGMAPAPTKWALAMVPLALWWVFVAHDFASCALTVEPLIAGYYLILSVVILGPSNALKALGLILCLMSRYSVVLWVPLYLWILWLRDARGALRIAALVVVGALVIYGPFLLHDPAIFGRAQANYFRVTLFEWNPPWRAAGAKPYHLFQGVGFAVYFYDFLHGGLDRRIAVLQNVHLAVLLLCNLALGALFLRLRDRVDEASFSLASLSLYLAFFYAFIQVPYAYLFLVPLFVSCTVVYRATTLSPAADAGALRHLARAGASG
jgi:hypothetical protein